MLNMIESRLNSFPEDIISMDKVSWVYQHDLDALFMPEE